MKTDRVVVVTGASGGMGRLVAERFLSNGDTVIATDTSDDALGKLNASPNLTTIAADISKESDCQAVADLARNKGGRIDVLVNVAGWFPVQPFEEISADDFRKVIDINLTGTFLMVRAVWPLMKGRGWGRIVSVGSTVGEGFPLPVRRFQLSRLSWDRVAESYCCTGDRGVSVCVVKTRDCRTMATPFACCRPQSAQPVRFACCPIYVAALTTTPTCATT